MKIIVFGNGLVGSQLAAHLVAAGHDATALGRDHGIDTTTGQGLAAALEGADVAVDLTNSPSWADDDVLAFFTSSTEHLLAAEREAGVRHHVILSIIGADRLPTSGYLRAKVAQERAVEAGGVPYSIVRSAQFFEFVPGIADAGTVEGVVHATSAHLQPIASRDVVAHLAEVVTGPAAGRRRRGRGTGAAGDRHARPPALRHHRRPARGPHRPARGLLRRRAGRHLAGARARRRRLARRHHVRPLAGRGLPR